MDYSSERRDFSSSRGGAGGAYYGPPTGGGGGSSFPSRGRGGHQFHRRGGGGPRRDFHHPYRRGGRGRGGGGRHHHHHGNRFNDQQESQDPQQAALRSLQQMICKLGELKAPPQTTTPEPDSQEPFSPEIAAARPLVLGQAQNVQALAKVLCAPTSRDIFLQYQEASSTVALDRRAGPLATGIVHAAATSPLQAPVYAALTLAVHGQISQGGSSPQVNHSNEQDGDEAMVTDSAIPSKFLGFSARVVDYAAAMFSRDLDAVLLEESESHGIQPLKFDPAHRSMLRLKLLLRFFVSLAKAGILVGYSAQDDPVVNATNDQPVSVLGLIESLVQAAVQFHEKSSDDVSHPALALAFLVYSIIPYLREGLVATENSSSYIKSKLVEPLNPVMDNYRSPFTPGTGTFALLLRAEQIEDMGEEDEEYDDDEEEEDDDPTEQICDTLQDLRRTVKFMLDSETVSHFELFNDAPWSYLKTESDGTDTSMSYSGEKLLVKVFPECKSLSKILGGGIDVKTVAYKSSDLTGVVFGRLPFFGPPPEARDDEDDDMEEIGNERMQAYTTNFGMVDRYFLSEAVRDCVVSHEMLVTDTGVEKGLVKTVAEHILSLRELFKDSTGIEFPILESVFSLLLHEEDATQTRTLYVSKILLELTRLDPSIIPAGIALAVTSLFNDYMPSLTPVARYSLGQWFAFYLIGTDFQWPTPLWEHWQSFLLFGWKNSRGGFVRVVMSFLFENLSDPSVLGRLCFPPGSAFMDHLIAGEDNIVHEIEEELRRRIWEQKEEAGNIVTYLTGDDSKALIESFSALDGIPPRTFLLAKALLKPLLDERETLRDWVESEKHGSAEGESAREDYIENREDAAALVIDSFSKYSIAFVAARAKDNEDPMTGSVSVESESLILKELYKSVSFSRSFFNILVKYLVQHKVVSPLGVLKWSLGSSVDGPVHRWWDFVITALRPGLASLRPLETPNTSDETEHKNFVTANFLPAIEYVQPVLAQAVNQASELASDMDSQSKGSRFTPDQVELIQGVKSLLVETKKLLLSFAADCLNAKDTDSDILTRQYRESSVSPKSLVANCTQIHGSKSFDNLTGILDNL